MSFLPDNYEAPKSGSENYLKFQDGDTKFRVLGSAVVGNELWVSKRPIRKRMGDNFTRDELERADLDQDGNPSRPRHFWAFPVYAYDDTRVKILFLTQKTIQDPLTALVNDEDWGDPTKYDIVVKRATQDKKTSYSVQPKPAKPLDKEAVELWLDVQRHGFDLSELFVNGDPFAPKNAVTIEDVG